MASIVTQAGTNRLSEPRDAEDLELVRQVMVLNHVEQDETLSQRQLAKCMSLNLSTVNQIVKRLVKKGFVKTRKLNGRSLAYNLTPSGFAEKLRLVFAYTNLSISFFSTVRAVTSEHLGKLQEDGVVATVAIIGTGELAEAVYLSVRERGLEITSVYMDAPTQDDWFGIKVHPLTAPAAESADD